MRIGGAHADQHLPATGLRSRCFNNLKNFWPAKMAELDGSHQRLATLDATARYLPYVRIGCYALFGALLTRR